MSILDCKFMKRNQKMKVFKFKEEGVDPFKKVKILSIFLKMNAKFVNFKQKMEIMKDKFHLKIIRNTALVDNTVYNKIINMLSLKEFNKMVNHKVMED